jgi:hypothetical protein
MSSGVQRGPQFAKNESQVLPGVQHVDPENDIKTGLHILLCEG